MTNYVKEYKITLPQQIINYKYTYDEVGNIKIVEENKEEIATYEYDKASRLVKEHNKKLNFTKTYTYDETHNPTTYGEANIRFDKVKNLKQIQSNNIYIRYKWY